MGVAHGIETATFHILTPYPGTALYQRMAAEGRLLHSDWDLYDTRHVVYRPARHQPDAARARLLAGVPRLLHVAHILRGAWTSDRWRDRARHVAYAAGWKKFEPAWDVIIRAKRASSMLPVLERVLTGFGEHGEQAPVSSDLLSQA